MPQLNHKEYVSQNGINILQNAMKDPNCKRGIKAIQKSLLQKEEGTVILAADITPFDLISHIPGLCKENKTRLLYINSRFDLKTENDKPTSCLFLPVDLLPQEEAHKLQ